MRFFGDTPVARIDQMKECLKQIEFTPFEIKIEGIGAFPNIRRPRVVWVGVADNSQMVIDLKSRIDEILTDIGYKGEKEKFTPHATIARIRIVKEPNRMRSNLEELANESIGNMIVKSVSMKKSLLTPSGPIYETLWTI
jgi:2'-5' RNA ligase